MSYSYTLGTPLEVFLFVAAIFGLVLAVGSLMSGWAALSRKYAFTGEPPPNIKRFQSLGMGYTSLFAFSYTNIIHAGVDREAVYLFVFIIFRPLHPPLKIPFSDLFGREGQFLFWRYVELRTKAGARPKIWIRKRLAEWFEDVSGGGWTFSRM